MPVTGIKETMEALEAVSALSVAMIEASKDGVQLSDFFKLGQNAELVSKMMKAGEGIAAVKDEMTDLDAAETSQLINVLTVSIGKQLNALGVQPSNRIVKILPLLPETGALAQKYYDALKPEATPPAPAQ